MSETPTTRGCRRRQRVRRHPPTCPATGKVRHRSPNDTTPILHAAARARRRSAEDGTAPRRRERRWYQCPSCDGYHLTSQA